MLIIHNRIIRKITSIILIMALIYAGPFSYPNTAYAERVVLSEETYYHLDMGVQVAYGPGTSWGRDYIYGSSTPISVNASINFNNDIEVMDTYQFVSSKGSSFDFNGNTSSHNIPKSLGDASWAYNFYYKDFTSTSMTKGSCSSSGKTVSFSYTARLTTSTPLEVVEYGLYGRDGEIYQLFGGKSALEKDQPRIADAIAVALKAGREGTAGNNKLYLIFCPNVIEYKKYITVGDLEAQLNLPSSAKQGENYTASDASLLDSSLTVDKAVLEKHYGDGNWEHVDTWPGRGLGQNTEGMIQESEEEICIITYRLTVTTTSGQVDSDMKTIVITDGTEVDGKAILELPEFTYEGHPAQAVDVSELEVDGTPYSARRAYEEGMASNRFRPLPSGSGSATKRTLTTADVTFNTKGFYNVRLEVTTKDGKELTDTKPIEVRKTPYIIDNLGGFQKENRKQTLNISVATYPGKPIIDYYIILKDLKTGDTITINKDQLMENSPNIKTRPHVKSGDSYWTNFSLEFLTKNTQVQQYQYTIYMKDSKGDTDTLQKSFTVRPDLPPDPAIVIQDTFIRNKGSNTAEIIVEDASATDGDQLERTWTVDGINLKDKAGYKDLLFGSGQKVQYDKTGVGKERISLFVKDVWIEPTLEEYVTEADKKSASTTAATDVINIAPTVRLEPIQSELADIAIVTNKALEPAIKAGLNSIKAALIEAGIDPNIQVIPAAPPNDEGYQRVGHYTWKIAINDPSQNTSGLVFDSEFAYVIEAAGYQMNGYQEVAIPPYTIKALKKSETDQGLIIAWSYTVTDSTNFRLKLDNLEKYVYLSYIGSNKTIMLNRDNGAYVTTLPVNIPNSNPFVTNENNNLYFLSADKIEKYDGDTQSVKTVINKGGSLGRMKDGKITFVGKDDSHKFYIGQFDMKTETITQKSIPELQEFVYADGSKSAVSPTDMDNNGMITFSQSFNDRNNDTVGTVMWIADTEQQRVYNMGRVSSTWDMRGSSLGFIKDERGKGLYIYHGFGDDDSTMANTRRYYYLNVYTMPDGDTLPVKRSIYGKRDNAYGWAGISYAKYHSQEDAIYIMQGAEWQGYDWGGSKRGVMCRIQIPSWSVDFNQYGWGWDIADEEGGWNDYISMTYYNYDNWVNNERRIKMFTNSITKEQAEESAMTRLADFKEGATSIIEKSYSNIQSLVDKVKAAVKERASLKLTNLEGKQINLSRSFGLKTGETYYYEYEVKKPEKGDGVADGKLNISPPVMTYDIKNQYKGTENLGSYYVSKIYSEDFNDGNIDPFFNIVDGSLNWALTTPGTTKGSSNRQIGMSATVKFNIPEGQKAVAVMDVRGNLGGPQSNYGQEDTRGFKSGVYINGKRYDKPLATGFNVNTYVHPYLLKEGENTIQAYCVWYGRGTDGYYISIDNLKIIFIESDPIPSKDTFVYTLAADGWTKVAGSFKTPEPVLQFKSQEMLHYPDWPAGLATSVNRNDTYYDFEIPEGYAGKIHATFQGYTYRDDTTAGTFKFPHWQVQHRGTESGTGSVSQYVNSNETLFVNSYQGNVRFTATAGNQRSVSFSKLEAYLYPNNLEGTNSFFFDNNKVYSISSNFAGDASINLGFDSNEVGRELLLQNLKIYYISNGNKVYLYNKTLGDPKDLKGWAISEGIITDMHREAKPERDEDAPLVYKKGELIRYNIFYDDYENDPSHGDQYWSYTHTPYNDGPHPDAAIILDEEGNIIRERENVLSTSIPKFYIDGKYTVEHWQKDNTNREGDTSGKVDYGSYDKYSNKESITFYVEGGATAPWITSIKTIPGIVKESDSYRIQVGVDDLEKDNLRLTTEIYKDKKLIYTHRQTGIVADGNGNYPLISTGYAPLAIPGSYEIVCTVRDETGAGLGTYRFVVVSEGRITGFVNHTPQWDINRKKYNLKRFGEEVNRKISYDEYMKMSVPRQRCLNVFWSGERFVLEAETEGKPLEVTVKILEENAQGVRKASGYSTTLKKIGSRGNPEVEVWEGQLWQKSMINKWGRKTPQKLVVIFEAVYVGGKTRIHEEEIIVDSNQDYWQLHRLW